MRTRQFGQSSLRASELGLGLEHLLEADQTTMNAVLRGAVEAGVNFFDVLYALPAWLEMVRRAFEPFPREKVVLGVHLAWAEKGSQIGNIRDIGACRDLFEMTLRTLATNYLDAAFIHNVDEQREFDSFVLPMLDVVEGYKDAGKTRAVGLSTHTVEIGLAALETGRVDVLMFPVNMSNHAMPGRRELLSECAERGVGIIAMKPFQGGRLLSEVEGSTAGQVLSAALGANSRGTSVSGCSETTAVRCLAYVLAQVGVSAVVPGVKDVGELEAALALSCATDEEKNYAATLAAVSEATRGECVHCNHCLPCPADINIGRVMRILDHAEYSDVDAARRTYQTLEANASDCIECGDCTERCPFEVDVIAKMQRAIQILETGN